MASRHTILYAEDDLDDLFIVTQAFEKQQKAIEIIHASNGLETLQVLDSLLPHNTTPCLIILDINMPALDGRETLMRLKQSERYHHIPVVMFSTSSSALDKAFAAKWGAAFFTKPQLFSEMEALVHTFIELCHFPTQQPMNQNS